MISAFGLAELRRVGTAVPGGIWPDGMLPRERTQGRIRRVPASFVRLGPPSLNQVMILQISPGSVLWIQVCEVTSLTSFQSKNRAESEEDATA